jgi:hypothetical protein
MVTRLKAASCTALPSVSPAASADEIDWSFSRKTGAEPAPEVLASPLDPSITTAFGGFIRGESLGIGRITRHDLRHTCASIFIAAGVNAKAFSTWLGHASIQIRLDRYGHLMPGNEDEAVALVDAYLERSNGAFSGARAAGTLPLSHF